MPQPGRSLHHELGIQRGQNRGEPHAVFRRQRRVEFPLQGLEIRRDLQDAGNARFGGQHEDLTPSSMAGEVARSFVFLAESSSAATLNVTHRPKDP